MKLRRGFTGQLFEIEVKYISAFKQGLLGQGIDGMLQQKPLSNQGNGKVYLQHIDILPISKVAIILKQILQMTLGAVQPKSQGF